MGPVEFNEIVRIANDVVRARHQAIESRAGIDRLQAQRAPVALDLDRLARGKDLIEDGVDILAQLRSREFHRGKICVRTCSVKRTYVLHSYSNNTSVWPSAWASRSTSSRPSLRVVTCTDVTSAIACVRCLPTSVDAPNISDTMRAERS